MEGELNCIMFLQNEQKIACGSTEEVIQIYKKGDYGDCSDRIVGFNSSVETMVKDKYERIFVGCEDGWVRVLTTYPHEIKLFQKHVEEEEQETMPVEKVDLSRC